MVQKCGVMYRDTVKGKFRLFSTMSMIRTAASGLPSSCAEPGFVRPSCKLGRNGIDPTVTGWKPEKRPRSATMASKRETDPLRISRMTDLLGLQNRPSSVPRN